MQANPAKNERKTLMAPARSTMGVMPADFAAPAIEIWLLIQTGPFLMRMRDALLHWRRTDEAWRHNRAREVRSGPYLPAGTRPGDEPAADFVASGECLLDGPHCDEKFSGMPSEGNEFVMHIEFPRCLVIGLSHYANRSNLSRILPATVQRIH